MLMIFVGKSGCGKSTIEKHFEKMISFTTRKAREGEVNGKDYYFYDRKVIEQEIPKFQAKQPTFIKQLSTYAGEYYGTSQEEVERIKKLDLAVAVMNLEGAKDMQNIMRENGVKTKIIWIDIDEDLRIERITGRTADTGETLEQIKLRLNEDFRDNEKEEVDYILENNGSLEEILKKINDLVEVSTRLSNL